MGFGEVDAELVAVAGMPAQRRPPEPPRLIDQEEDDLEAANPPLAGNGVEHVDYPDEAVDVYGVEGVHPAIAVAAILVVLKRYF